MVSETHVCVDRIKALRILTTNYETRKRKSEESD